VVCAATLGAAAVALARPPSPPSPAISLGHFPDGPPARVTGGFGEDSCAACHFPYGDAPPAGRLEVSGFPDCYRAGERYELTVALEDDAMEVAGFQLAVRLARDTSRAGELTVPDDERGRVAVVRDRDVDFAQHTLDGTDLVDAGTARWRVHWTAPAGHGKVLLHAAGLAGDGDRSQEGDRTYTVERRAGGKACRR
jgi:hypothetical protein